MVFEPGQDGKVGHYTILSSEDIKNHDYQPCINKKTCWLDSLIVQLSPEEHDRLGGRDGIIK